MALAADIAPAQQDQNFDERRWMVIVSPYAWAASLNGNAGIAGFSTEVDVPFSETVKNLDFSLMGNIEITNGLYGVYFDGQYTKTSQDEDIASRTIEADVTSTTLSAGAYYRVYETQLGGTTVFGDQQIFAFEPTVGVRWTQLETTIDVGRFSASRKVDWTDPFIGARILADLNDRWNLFAEADVGGFGAGSDLSIQAQAYLGYRTFILDQPTVLRVGYRALYQDFETEDFTGHTFKWDVTQHGPVIGASIRF
ncbi:MAG: hypothetical protein ACRECW_05180 [Phyllobacterium sp.]